jgi:hypothetical protein
MNGEDVAQKMQYIQSQLRIARSAALNIVNTPNFRELQDVWAANRRAMYGKYYDMFSSYGPIGRNRLV